MIFNIPPHVAFVDALAAGLLARIPDTLALARTQILLPNRRAVRALTDAFVRHADGGLLLPRMIPVGDLADDAFDRLASGDSALPAEAGKPLLPPAVPPLLRRLELARLVRALPSGAGEARSPVEALRLGDQLGATLDALLIEEVSPEALRTAIADRDLADHWQATLAFLEIVISSWPPARDRSGYGDAGTRVAALIDALVARWAGVPPATPVVAAGITGSSPPLVRLLAAVDGLPQGMIVLPGLDTDLSPVGTRRWAAITARAADAEATADPGIEATAREAEEHPQYALKSLLGRLGVDRADVIDWAVATPRDGPAARTVAVMAAMAPAAAAAGWHLGLPDPLAFDGVSAVEAATPAEEAQVIALALREALTVDGRCAALVTPDRTLARRVAAHCRRWGLVVDDSAGTPLRLTPPGTLALALVEAAAQGFAPVALLAALKHPLVTPTNARPGAQPLAAGGSENVRGAWLGAVRRLDLALRGVRPPPGLEFVAEQLERGQAAAMEARRRDGADAATIAAAVARDSELRRWWAAAAKHLEPLARVAEARAIDLAGLAAALRETGTALCGEALWRGADGRALAALIDGLEADGATFGDFAPDDAPALVAALLSDIAVRPGYTGHPRLRILGPLEAQLQRADLMILGGLNEATWPGTAAPDPWLAPAIRGALGLPGLARATGLAAHDFVGGLGARHVLLTRARRDASAPLVASRFWLRLQAFSGGLAQAAHLLHWARRLDGGGPPLPAPPPRPNPPVERRPRAISVTEVDTLVADPFAFYARNLLRLRVLDPLDQDPTAATRGNRIHEVMERWIGSGGGSLERLAQFTEEMLAAEGALFPLLRALWAPRARRGLLWAGGQVHAREGAGWHAVAAEAAGRFELPGGIVLRGRADRIDRDAAGNLAVIDYKTGRAPTAVQVKAGLANQLGLLLAMAAAGRLRARGGEAIAPGEPAAIAYWKLSGGTTPGRIEEPLLKRPPMAAVDHVAEVVAHADAVSTRLLLHPTPFESHRQPGLGWGDYDHLARVAEWQDRPGRL